MLHVAQVISSPAALFEALLREEELLVLLWILCPVETQTATIDGFKFCPELF